MENKKEEILILVDETDRPTGFETKSEIHKRGLLHRAFSIFVFNSRGELLLQKRAKSKYHSAGLWTNSCCGHPVKDESISDAASRRLMEEMNMDIPLEEICTFSYRAEFENGLIENEFDHIFYTMSDVKPVPNESEVDEWKYLSTADLIKDVNQHPEKYTAWFKMIIDRNLLGDLIKA